MQPTPPPVGAPIVPADWSQFIPDLLSSAIIGLIVGFALYRWQRSIETGADRRAAESSWGVARTSLEVGLMHPFRRAAGQGETRTFLLQLDGLMTALRATNVAVWADSAPGNAELSAARDILRDVPTLTRLGGELERDIKKHLQIRRGGYADVKWLVDFAIRRIIGTEDDETSYEGNREEIEAAMSDAAIAPKVARFREMTDRVEAAHVLLRGNLGVG